MIVRGSRETVLIDPSLTIAASTDPPAGIDRILISHCHEDHVAGVFRYPSAQIHVHVDEVHAMQSLDGLMSIYGMPADMEASWRDEVVRRFHYVPRPDAQGYRDGDEFDL